MEWIVLALTPPGCATRQEFKARMAKMEAGLATEKGRVDQLTTQLATVTATATEATRIGTEVRRSFIGLGEDRATANTAAAVLGWEAYRDGVRSIAL